MSEDGGGGGEKGGGLSISMFSHALQYFVHPIWDKLIIMHG